MMTLERLNGVFETTPVTAANVVERTEDVQKRLFKLETLHYRWVPWLIVGLVGGYLLMRKKE